MTVSKLDEQEMKNRVCCGSIERGPVGRSVSDSSNGLPTGRKQVTFSRMPVTIVEPVSQLLDGIADCARTR